VAGESKVEVVPDSWEDNDGEMNGDTDEPIGRQATGTFPTGDQSGGSGKKYSRQVDTDGPIGRQATGTFPTGDQSGGSGKEYSRQVDTDEPIRRQATGKFPTGDQSGGSGKEYSRQVDTASVRGAGGKALEPRKGKKTVPDSCGTKDDEGKESVERRSAPAVRFAETEEVHIVPNRWDCEQKEEEKGEDGGESTTGETLNPKNCKPYNPITL
jgi:hypothetical protein